MKKVKALNGVLFITLLIIIGGLCVSCDEDDDPSASIVVPSDFLPKDGDIEGWEKGETREADDYTSLYDIIDGGAEIYIDHGFVEGVHQNYNGSILSNNLTLELIIYDMGDTTGAYDIFHDAYVTPPSHSPQDFGDEGRLNEGLLSVYAIDFRKDKYYVKLSLMKAGIETESLQMLRLFASTVVSNMEN